MGEQLDGLIVLESSKKKQTIAGFLNQKGEKYKNFKIIATTGHLWEIVNKGKYNLGIDLEKTFEPTYDIINSKKNLVKFWKDYIKKFQKIYLATDGDREGEMISKEFVETLNLDPSIYCRMIFYEVTPESVFQAMENPVKIDENLIEAQISRQVIDKIIGFTISPLVRKHFKTFSSAGRIQSVVLRMISDREKEVIEQEREENKSYNINLVIKVDKKEVNLIEIDNRDSQIIYKNLSEAEKNLEKIEHRLKFIGRLTEKKVIPPKNPLMTSDLLFEARNKGISVKKTTKAAQELYEGIWLKDKKKRIGLITYPRTDSIRMNKIFTNSTYKLIEEKWGKEFCNFNPLWKNKKKGPNSQGAHESIHPTNLAYNPNLIESSLTKEQYKIYKIIYDHSIVSLMSPITVEEIKYNFSQKEKKFLFKEKIQIKPGFSIYDSKFLSLYKIKKQNTWKNEDFEIEIEKKEIKENLNGKVNRYREGEIIRALEKEGIGRPSTYGMFVNTIQKRGYVKLDKTGHLIPTELGLKVDNWLKENFSDIINKNYTAKLEKELDDISNGRTDRKSFIKNFWEKLEKRINSLTN